MGWLRRLVGLPVVALWLVGASACGTSTSQSDGAAGCPDDTPAKCPGAAPSYATDVAPLFESRCGSCHAPTGQEPTHPFQTYAQVFSQRATILSQLHACKMPPADAPQPSAAERVAILTWLVCGAPNN